MIAIGDVFRALYGAYRLARFDADGLRFLDTSLDGFWRSFFAAVLVAPFYGALMLLRQDDGLTVASVLIDSLAYVINWVAFPVLMLTLAKMIERERHYVRYIVAVNWASALQNAVFIPVAMLGVVGAIPVDASALLSLMVLAWTLMYSGFVAHKALDVPVGTAAALVAADLVLGVVINGLAAGAGAH